jgi:3-deoxy-D-manno-octulosonic-acid transferase
VISRRKLLLESAKCALALRALVAALEQARPGLRILVTTGTRGAAEALASNGIGQALHQFMPLDLPAARRRFLDHWRPDYVVWSEQDIWPGFVHALARRGVPQAWVNARMDAKALERRRRGARLFAAVYRQFRLISAQDVETAAHIATLGCPARVDGSLKPAALPLADQPQARANLDRQFGSRRRWQLASSHAEDEAVALRAHTPRDLLIISPRYP